MKKVYLIPIKQKDSVFYIGKYDPRKLVYMTDQAILSGNVQEAQRPLEPKHLKEVSNYVGGENNFEGLLPGSILLGTKDNDLLPLKEEFVGDEKKYYINFPFTPEELEKYKNTIDVMDGQHRLFSFHKQYISPDLKDDTEYEIPFSLFITPSMVLRRQLFTFTNDRQKPVSKNLLLYMKEQLNLLNDSEKKYLPIINLLATENNSPLKDRIVLNSEKVSKGLKSSQLVSLFDKAKLKELSYSNKKLTDNELEKVISIYLRGWEKFYSVSFKKPGKETITKISGLRYIIMMCQVFYENSVTTRTKFSEDYVKDLIQKLEDAKNLTEEQTLFDDSLIFRGETSTLQQAKEDGDLLKNTLANDISQGFNPLS